MSLAKLRRHQLERTCMEQWTKHHQYIRSRILYHSSLSPHLIHKNLFDNLQFPRGWLGPYVCSCKSIYCYEGQTNPMLRHMMVLDLPSPFGIRRPPLPQQVYFKYFWRGGLANSSFFSFVWGRGVNSWEVLDMQYGQGTMWIGEVGS